jgi:glucose-1-phosphate thymidylyltransferase
VFQAFEGDDAVKPSARGEYEITDLYSYLLKHGFRVETEQVDGRWMDPGKFTDMLEANAYILNESKHHSIQGTIDDKTHVEGAMVLGVGSAIVNSTIYGPVSIAEDVIIEDAIIGPNVSIQSKVQLKSMTLRNSIIMSGSTLTHLSKPVVNTMIGRNTVVVEEDQQTNSFFIGDHCNVRLN